MGLSECWIGVRADAATADTAIVALGAESLGEAQGWCWGRPPEDPDLDAVVCALARDLCAPAVGGWVADSDCAYLVFATPDGGIGARVAINDTLPFGEPMEGMPDLWGDHSAREAAFEDLARWSSEHAAHAVEASSLLREMPGWPESSPPYDGPFFADDDPWYDEGGETGWVFAEDGVRLVYHRLGLPSIDEAVLAHPASGSDEVSDGSTGRAFFGQGEGTLGVYGGDEQLQSSLAEFLGPIPGADWQVIDESLDDATWWAERSPRRYQEQDPEWLAGALGLVREWLSKTGTEHVWVWLNSWTTGGLAMQCWAVTADDSPVAE